MYKVLNGENIKNMPWRDRPDGCTDVVWRDPENPIMDRSLIKNSNSIFNSAVVPFGGEFRGVFRSDDTTRRQTLHAGRSKDGVHWELTDEMIHFECDIDEIKTFEYGYDPRVCGCGVRMRFWFPFRSPVQARRGCAQSRQAPR